ncbi:hypothetical protein GUITHDRAFT_149547, partial [Guillardia theta CCMP2712]
MRGMNSGRHASGMGGRRGRVLEEVEEGLGKREEMREGIFHEVPKTSAAICTSNKQPGGMLAKMLGSRDVVALSIKQTLQDLSIMVGLEKLFDALVSRARSRRLTVEASGRSDAGDVVSVLKERLELRRRASLSIAKMKVQTEVPAEMLKESIEDPSLQDRRNFKSILFDQLVSTNASQMFSSAKFHALTMKDLLDAMVDYQALKTTSSLSQLRIAILYLACNFNGKYLMRAGENVEEVLEQLEESLIRIAQALQCEEGERELALGLWWLDAGNLQQDHNMFLATRYLCKEEAKRVLPRFLRSAVFSSLYDVVFASSQVRSRVRSRMEPSLISMSLMTFKNLDVGQSANFQDVALYLVALQNNSKWTTGPQSLSSGWIISEAMAIIMQRMCVTGAFRFIFEHNQQVDEQSLLRSLEHTLQSSLKEHFDVEDFSISCCFEEQDVLPSNTRDENENVDVKSASVRFRLQFESEEGCKQAFAIFTSDVSKEILAIAKKQISSGSMNYHPDCLVALCEIEEKSGECRILLDFLFASLLLCSNKSNETTESTEYGTNSHFLLLQHLSPFVENALVAFLHSPGPKMSKMLAEFIKVGIHPDVKEIIDMSTKS